MLLTLCLDQIMSADVIDGTRQASRNAFYTSTLLEKYANLAGENWKAFLTTPGAKTEAAFADFIRNGVGLMRAVAVKRIRQSQACQGDAARGGPYSELDTR